MLRKLLTIFSLVCIALWWVFLVLWQPVTVVFIARVTTSSKDQDWRSMDTIRLHAFSIVTQGTTKTDDIFFTPNEMSHLIDVHSLYLLTQKILSVSAATSWVVLIAMILRKEKMTKSLTRSALILFVLAILGLLSLLVFEPAFTLFHWTLFPQGNWEFPANSLLIQSFPESFWMGSLIFILAMIISFSCLYYLVGRNIRES